MVVNSREFEDWLRALEKAAGTTPAVHQRGRVEVKVIKTGTISLPPGPTGMLRRITLTFVGKDHLHSVVRWDDTPAPALTIALSPVTQSLVMEGSVPLQGLDLYGHRNETTISVDLRVPVIACRLHRAQYNFSNPPEITGLTLGGTIACRDGLINVKFLSITEYHTVFVTDLQASRTQLRSPEAHFSSEEFPTIRLGQVSTREGGPVTIRLKRPMHLAIEHLPSQSRVFLHKGCILTISRRRPHISATEMLSLHGSGTVEVSGQVSGLDFGRGHDEDVSLDIKSGGIVLDGSGVVSLRAEQGAVCSGNPVRPLELVRVSEVAGAELDNVSLYELDSLASLEVLSLAQRLDPWIPRSRTEARQREDAMTLGTGDDQQDLRFRTRAHFWSRLANIVAESNAAGDSQSAIRYAAQRARLRAASGRERSLLQTYALIGFGERISWPLGWMLIVAITSALAVDPGQVDLAGTPSREAFGNWLELAGRLLLLPISISGLVDPPEAQGFARQALLVADRAILLTLLGFTVLAIRRLARIE